MMVTSQLDAAPRVQSPRSRPAVADIALLVSTYQKPSHLERVLVSIAAQEGVDGRFEVVVTDDGSTDETAELVERFARQVPFRVAYTTHAHQTFQLARCRNEGVAASEAPYLLFLDGDCILPTDHVQMHLKHRRPNQVMGGYCCRLDEPTSRRITSEEIKSRRYLDWIPRSELRSLAVRDFKSRFYAFIGHPRKPKLAGGNIGIWRSDFERVNGFNRRFEGWGAEDDDLRLRLRRLGVRIRSILRWTRTYHLWHPIDPTAPARLREGRNFGYYHQKGRLTRCRHGLVERPLDRVCVVQVGTPQRPDLAAALLRGRVKLSLLAPQVTPEVEILFHPGQGRFSGRADCKLLIALECDRAAQRLAQDADYIVSDAPLTSDSRQRTFRLCELDRALAEIG